ncbi:E3 ubiquitin-protein ligase ORTHRUS 2 [Nymphaea thermarum]|nr:E3 ubiquitin-protein ligase ORTHRUS 2 [Nymphaea thermarum]
MGLQDLPCDSDGVCMVCKVKPDETETLLCSTCATPWHGPCLASPPASLSSVINWQCPDCSPPDANNGCPQPSVSVVAGNGESNGLLAAIRAIQADDSLSEPEKAKKRQELMTRNAKKGGEEEKGKKQGKGEGEDEQVDGVEEDINCAFCLQLPERPVTTPCGHNFCLRCFQKWVGQGKRTCAKCRGSIPARMVEQPRINAALVAVIRMSRKPRSASDNGVAKAYNYSIHNKDRPDQAFTTERAKRAGKANACSGKIFVTVPPDHFGPIAAENDPIRNQGVLVGECWEDRMECRQWGTHLPHVAGIAGQSDYGAQSVALSGGYQDDEDHGEWFLYTGSGGRDLSGNKRTNKEQSFDQKFEKMNEALRVSCKKGYPVRVVRSHKEKRSSYAPESGVRYDGVYRIEKCWRKVGIQGFKVCRYLFVRCDNEPAPWTSDLHGDRPRQLPSIKELKVATDITERKGSPSWDWEEGKGWFWKQPPPRSRRQLHDQSGGNHKSRKARSGKKVTWFPPEILCCLCRKLMTLPVTTSCGHSFCKACLEAAFPPIRERSSAGGRSLRTQKAIRKCPTCTQNIEGFFENPQVNLDLQTAIEKIKKDMEDNMLESSEGEDAEKVMDGGESPEPPLNYESEENIDAPAEAKEADASAKVHEAVTADKNKLKRKGPARAIPTRAQSKRLKEGKMEDQKVEDRSPSSPLLVQSDGDFE